MQRRILSISFSFGLVLASAAGAQQVGVAELRERVAQLRDTAEIRRLEEAHRRSGEEEDALAAGFAALQLWELTGRKEHAARSRRYFDRAAERNPENAWAHYGHALSFAPDIALDPGFLALDDAVGRVIGMNAVSRARRALERAVELDPQLPGAAALLARYAVSTWNEEALAQAHATLAAWAARGDAPSDVLLALSRTELERGRAEAAVRAAERVVARADALHAQAQLELAAALAVLPQRAADAGRAWFAALADADSTLLLRLWSDAAFIAREPEAAEWQQARTPERRRQLLRAFWDMRGALAAGTAEERVGEHYARLHHAWQRHRRWGQLGAAPANALRLEKLDPRFTDPGIIYIRHGAPDFIYDDRRSDYLVWYYRDEDGGPLSYHFARHAGESGYSQDPVLIRRLPCLHPDAALHDPRLRPLTYGCNAMRTGTISATVRRDAERALGSDSDLPDFRQQIPFSYDLYTFRGNGGATDVVAAVGVPAAAVPADAPPLRVMLAVIDTARAVAHRGIIHANVPELSPGDVVRTFVATAAEPALAAAYRVDVRAAHGEAGMTYGGTLEVRGYRAGVTSASDVVLAEPDNEGGFVRGPHRLALVPAQVFPGGRFRVFYELYDVPAAARYRTELSIEPAERGLGSRLLGRGKGVSLRFDEEAPDPGAGTLYQLREITAPVEPGTYVLRIRITSPEWKGSIERERRFTVPAR